MKVILVALIFSFALQAKSVFAQNNISITPEAVHEKILSNPDFKVGSFLIEVTCGLCDGYSYDAYWYYNTQKANINHAHFSNFANNHIGDLANEDKIVLEKIEENIKYNWWQRLVMNISFFFVPKSYSKNCVDGENYDFYYKEGGKFVEKHFQCDASSGLEYWLISKFPKFNRRGF